VTAPTPSEWFPPRAIPPDANVLAAGLLVGALFTLLSGLSQGVRPTHVSPNEGIRLSARNGATVLAVTACALVLVCSLVGALLGVSSAGVFGVAFGGCAALIFGLSAGLGAVTHHWSVRLLLWGYGLGPIDYARWLQQVNARRIVYWSVGGGYVFVHALVRDFLDVTDRDQPHLQPDLGLAS
jgi:hypothetical protein